MAIPRRPELPPALKHAVDDGELVVFSGAGASRLLGCQGWDELARELVRKCLERRYIDFQEYVDLTAEPDHRKTITICRHLFLEQNDITAFNSAISASLEIDPQKSANYPIYDDLRRLRAALHVTTNIDSHFHEFFRPELRFHRYEQIARTPISDGGLYQIHGSIQDPSSLVLTLPEYLKAYRREGMRNFLRTLFRDYQILFIGYGLNELQLLELAVNEELGSRPNRHFMLMPLFGHQEGRLKFEQAHLSNYGIDVHAFDISDRGYEQLYEVVHLWSQQINWWSLHVPKTLERLEQLGAKFDSADVEWVIQTIEKEPDIGVQFYRKAHDERWLAELTSRGIYDPKNNPVPEKGGVQPWRALDYLENLGSKFSAISDSSKTEVLSIARQILDHRRADGSRIENYSTDWRLSRLICRAPLVDISPQDIDRISLRLKEDSSGGLISHELMPKLFARAVVEGHTDFVQRLMRLAFTTADGELKGHHGSLLDLSYVNEALIEHLDRAIELANEEMTELALSRIEEIDAEPWEYLVMVPDVSGADLSDRPPSLQTTLVVVARESLLGAVGRDLSTAKAQLERCLRSEMSVLNRIALVVIDQNWPDLEDSFWSVASAALLCEGSLFLELRRFLERHYVEFTDTQKDTVLRWIDEMPCWDGSSQDVPSEKELLRAKLRWTSAVSKSGYNKAIEAHADYLEARGGLEPKFMDAAVNIDVGSWSPISDAYSEALSGSPEDIAKTITDVDLSGPYALEDLGGALRDVVANRPEDFVPSLAAFDKTDLRFRAEIASGLSQAASNGQEIDWVPVLDWLTKTVDSLSPDEEGAERMLARAADAVQTLLRSEMSQSSGVNDNSIETLLTQIIRKSPPSFSPFEDPVLSALNEPRGVATISLLLLSTDIAKREGKDFGDSRWPASIRTEFESLVGDDKAQDDALWGAIGRYLASIFSLDPKWVDETLLVSPALRLENNFHAFLLGHLSSSTFIVELYDVLKSHGVFDRAIGSTLLDNDKERLVDLIGLAYLSGRDQLEDPDSPFGLLFHGEDLSVISTLARYFWSQRTSLESEQRIRVRKFWDQMVQKLSPIDETNSECVEAASDLNLLTAFADVLDKETIQQIHVTLPFVEVKYNVWSFIEVLDGLADSQPAEAGQLFFDLLEKDVAVDHPMEKIRSIVEKTYASGDIDLGNAISNFYLLKGIEDLKDIQERYS